MLLVNFRSMELSLPGAKSSGRESFRCILELSRYRAFSLPGQFAPRSESANRTLANSLPGTFAPWNFRSLALSYPGLFAPWKVLWNFRSLNVSYVTKL